MTWAEKFRVLRQTLNWPAMHIMEYIDAGYKENAYRRYNEIENEKEEPSDYLIQCICKSFYVNPAWIESGEGNILLDKRRIRSEVNAIQQRAHKVGTAHSLTLWQKTADNLNVGMEWLLCGDEKAKDNPMNSHMISFLQSNQELRRTIWLAMGNDTRDEFYNNLSSAASSFSLESSPLARAKLLNSHLGISQNQFEKEINVTIHNVKALSELQINKVATFGNVSRDWIRTGNTESLAWPCDNQMIIWLREHPEVRGSVADQMK